MEITTLLFLVLQVYFIVKFSQTENVYFQKRLCFFESKDGNCDLLFGVLSVSSRHDNIQHSRQFPGVYCNTKEESNENLDQLASFPPGHR